MRLFGQFSWASISIADRDLIVPKSASSTNFRAVGCTASRALGREACGAARAPGRRANPAGGWMASRALLAIGPFYESFGDSGE